MVIFMKANISKGFSMAMDFCSVQRKDGSMKESGSMGRCKDLAHVNGKMALSTVVSGWKASRKEMDFLHMWMDQSMKDIFIQINPGERAPRSSSTELFTKDLSKMASSMDKVITSKLMAQST